MISKYCHFWVLPTLHFFSLMFEILLEYNWYLNLQLNRNMNFHQLHISDIQILSWEKRNQRKKNGELHLLCEILNELLMLETLPLKWKYFKIHGCWVEHLVQSFYHREYSMKWILMWQVNILWSEHYVRILISTITHDSATFKKWGIH